MINRLYIASIACLNNEALYNKALSKMSLDRLNKINNYRTINDKYLSIGAELLLIKAIADLHINKPIRYKYNEYKKPFLFDDDICFNIAHSNEYVVCAISDKEVGVDIEYIKKPNIDVAKRFFHKEEYDYVISGDNVVDRFYTIWTSKEAYIKKIGTGLSTSLNSFNVLEMNNIKQIEINNYKCAICLDSCNDIEIQNINLNDVLNNI